MTNKLSSRERKVLLGLGIFLLLFLMVQFVILPRYQNMRQQQLERDLLSVRHFLVERKINEEDAIRTRYAEAQKDYTELLRAYPAELPNEGIDAILTGLCQTLGLQPTMLSITDTVVPELPVTEPAEPLQEGVEAPKSVRRIATASMDVRGGYDTVKALTDAVAQQPNLRLLRCALRPSAENGSVVDGAQIISLTFELTMLEQTPD